jgi:glycosyltransferase involved in cell wall biosynthesis
VDRVIIGIQAFNAEKTLCRAIDSILCQTYPDFICYVYDNGSSDGTGDIIREYTSVDSRIMGRFNAENDITLLHKNTPDILRENPDMDYFTYLDADDEYSPEFLEKMLAFADIYNLDIAAAGTQFVDEVTKEVIQLNAPPKNIIVERDEFADRFIEWRRFHCVNWGKLFRATGKVRKIRNFAPGSINNKHQFSDSDMEINIVLLQKAKRIGIYSEILHTYYQTKNSFSRHFRLDILESRNYIFELYYDLLCQFGEVSKVNTDYLYAVWLGWMEDSVRQLATSDLTLERKHRCVMAMLQHSITQQMLNCEPDPQFRNLANRAEFPRRLAEQFDLRL